MLLYFFTNYLIDKIYKATHTHIYICTHICFFIIYKYIPFITALSFICPFHLTILTIPPNCPYDPFPLLMVKLCPICAHYFFYRPWRSIKFSAVNNPKSLPISPLIAKCFEDPDFATQFLHIKYIATCSYINSNNKMFVIQLRSQRTLDVITKNTWCDHKEHLLWSQRTLAVITKTLDVITKNTCCDNKEHLMWSQRTFAVITKNTCCDHKEHLMWSQRTLDVITKNICCDHKEHLLWSQKHLMWSQRTLAAITKNTWCDHKEHLLWSQRTLAVITKTLDVITKNTCCDNKEHLLQSLRTLAAITKNTCCDHKEHLMWSQRTFAVITKNTCCDHKNTWCDHKEHLLW